MPDFTVRRYGTDSSGRPIWMTVYMAEWWEQVEADLDFTPMIVQGAFMVRNGGGADASAGYHDAGGCLDLRTWDLTGSQVDRLVHVLREHGAAAWRRDRQHGGMDPHLHFVLGADAPLARGAASQWQAYIQGRDGLASNGPDYEWRPNPLALTPPEDDMKDADWSRLEALLDAKLKAQQTSIVKAIWAEAVDKSGTAAKAALRKAMGK